MRRRHRAAPRPADRHQADQRARQRHHGRDDGRPARDAHRRRARGPRAGQGGAEARRLERGRQCRPARGRGAGAGHPRRRDRRRRGRVGKRPARTRRSVGGPAQRRSGQDAGAWRGLHGDATRNGPTQGCLPAGGAAAQRLRRRHVGGREHRAAFLRPAALLAGRHPPAPQPDARDGAQADRGLQGEDAGTGCRHPRPVRRQRAARGAGARTVERGRSADRGQSLLRPRLRRRRRDPRPHRAGPQPRRRRAAGERGPRRDPSALRPHRRHVRRQARAADRRGHRRRRRHRPRHGGASMHWHELPTRAFVSSRAQRGILNFCRARIPRCARDDTPFVFQTVHP